MFDVVVGVNPAFAGLIFAYGGREEIRTPDFLGVNEAL